MSDDSATVISKSFGPNCDKFPGKDAVRTHYTKSNTYRWKCCGRQSRLHPVTLVGGNDRPVPPTEAVSLTGNGAQVPPQEPAPTEHSAVANRSAAADGAGDAAPRKSISQNFGRNCNLFPDRDAIRIYYPNCHRFKWKCCEKQSRLHPVTEVGGDPPTTANASLAQPPVQAAVLGDDDDHNEQSGQHPVEVEATDSVAAPVSAEAAKSNAAVLPNQMLANGMDASMPGGVSSPPIGGRSETAVPVSLTSLRYPSSERFDSTMSVSLDVGQPGPQLEAAATQRPPLPLEAESNRYQEVQVSDIENGSQAECKVVKVRQTGQLLFTKRVKRLGEMTTRYEKALQASKYLLVPRTPLHLMKYIGIELGVDNENTDYFDIYMPFVPGTVQLTPSAYSGVPIKPLCCLALGASRGLQELHGMGLLHRDIKPANILFIPNADGRGYRAVVIDVELGKEVESAEHSPSITPTQRYASPEERGKDPQVGAPSDVYRLGMTLLHLLMGNDEWTHVSDRRTSDMAIRTESLVEALEKIRVQHDDVKRVSAVCDVIHNTLCSEPSERYTLEQIICRISSVYSENDSANLKLADFGPTPKVHVVIKNDSAVTPSDVSATPLRSETTENVSDDSTPGLSSLPAHRESD